MASQILVPDSYVAGGTGIILEQTAGNRDQIDTDLTEGSDVRFFQSARVALAGVSSNRLTIANSQTQGFFTNQDISDQFEQNGSVTIEVGTLSATIETSSDTTEPYTLDRNAASEAFAAAVIALSPQPAAADFTITLDDGAGVTPADPLTLSDWDDTGLTVDFAALIEISGTPDLYEDADRGGTDVPIEGELGLGNRETVISGFRWDGVTLRFYDNDNPLSLNLGGYYSSGGNGQTIYLVVGDADSQTEASFDVATHLPASRSFSFINWGFGAVPLPADVIALLDGLSVGDRLIVGGAEEDATTVEGDGAPIEGEGSLGEAEGTTASPPVAPRTYGLGEWFGGPWSGAIQIDSSLVADGGAAYLRYLAHSSGSITLRFATTATGVPPLPGPELSDDWEGYEEAVVLTDGAGNTVTIRGPAHPDNTSTDPTEPYSWTPENSADFTAWSAAAVDSEISITLADGPDTEYGDGAAIEGVGSLGEATGLAPVEGEGASIEGVGSLGEATGLVPVEGAGSPIEGVGSLGEATGHTPVHGEGAPIEGVGSLGEADGVVPVAGDGAPIEGRGSLGEAEGETFGTVTGEGDAIEGRGSLGEAEGEELDVVRGEGASIEGEGSLGEGEGIANPTVYGDGDGLRGEGSLGNAEGRTEIGAVDLKLYVNFTGSLTGTPDPTDTNDPWSDVTSVISITRGMVFDCVDGTQDHHFAPDIIRVRLRQSRDATLVRKVRASRRIGGVLIMHGEIVWRGFILSGKAQRVDDAPDDLEIEGVDHAERLRVPCGAVDERDATVLEIVESLISSVPGVVTDDTSDIVHMEPNVDATRLETMVEHFARRPGEATILALIDGLLHQYGYILYARANGLFGVRSWWYSETEYDDHTATAPRLVDDGFMQSGLRSEHRETNHESVAVEWSDVIEQDNALLYRENLPINSEGEHTGVIVLGGTNYPARGGVDAIWQEYRPDWLVGAAGRGSGGDLLYATNQSVEIDVDTDIRLQTEVHEPLRSRVVLRNTGTNDTRRLRQFDIRGDAVFRSATRVTVVTTIPAVQTTVDDAVSNTVIRLEQTTDNTVDTADGAYVGWTAVVAGIDATVLSYDGSDLEITLAAEPDGWAVADDDNIVLRPPANGDTLRMQADAVFDVDDARALAVASKNDILQAESYRFPAQYEDTPVVGSEALTIGQFVRLTYPDWELDELVCIVRERLDIIGEIAGGEPSRVELELIPVVKLDSTDAFPGPTLAAAGISVQQGPPGSSGTGREFIFAKTSTTTAPSLPSNSWGYDSPISPWQDSAPALDATDMFLWSAQRIVVGSPATGDAVSDTWSTPVIVGRFGEDGIIGANGTDGADGIGIEFIFAKTSTTKAPSAPSNSWGYDSPISPWSDGAPDLDSTDRFLWRAQRDVEGAPSVGDAISDTWSTPVIVGHFGEDGAAGADGNDGTDGSDGTDGQDGGDGVPGDRGSTNIAHEISRGNSWSGAGSTVDGTDYSGGDDIADALAGYDGGPQPNDYVTLYRGTFVETRVYDGSDWATVDAFLDGNLIVDGSVIADKLAANSVTAVKIAANSINASKIVAGGVGTSEIVASAITAALIATGAVGSSELAANAVTSVSLAANSVGASEIIAGSITATQLAANSVTASEIAANSVGASEIIAGSISASTLTAGSITARELGANSVTASELSAGSVNLGSATVTGLLTASNISSSVINSLLSTIGNASQRVQIVGDTIAVQRYLSSAWRTVIRMDLSFSSGFGGVWFGAIYLNRYSNSGAWQAGYLYGPAGSGMLTSDPN